MRRSFRSEAGQTSTEMMLVISVVVVAVVAAAYSFVPIFQDGVQKLAADVQSILDNGTIGAIGLSRGDDAGTGSGGGREANGVSPNAIIGYDGLRTLPPNDPTNTGRGPVIINGVNGDPNASNPANGASPAAEKIPAPGRFSGLPAGNPNVDMLGSGVPLPHN